MIEQVQAEKLRGQIDVADNANRPSAFPQLVIGEGVQKSSFRAVIGIVPAVGSLSGFDLAFPDLHAQRARYAQRQRVVSLADREPTRAVLPDHIGTALRVVYQHNAVAVRVERAADKAGYAPDLLQVGRAAKAQPVVERPDQVQVGQLILLMLDRAVVGGDDVAHIALRVDRFSNPAEDILVQELVGQTVQDPERIAQVHLKVEDARHGQTRFAGPSQHLRVGKDDLLSGAAVKPQPIGQVNLAL